ncbi:MAG: hypothetical protein EZS28_007343 [Streblomastix strix]|uniref:DDE-1 domain-containing protein n=1 Tax=Streblomastix strix TaxID=222440 RepID=A0A5J4WQT4_9EUKA|nr:MAG: hypothetical protein EZS28_007343 [Streblomastix strix]
MQGLISMAVTVGLGAFTPPPVFILSKECKLKFTQRLNPFAPECQVVDSHSSRVSATANRKFKQSNIISITFPQFLTSCTLPADVCINHSLRADFRKNLLAIRRQTELAKRTIALTQEEKVIAMVSARKYAHQSSTTRIAREITFRGTSSNRQKIMRKIVADKILTYYETLAWLDERAERRRVGLIGKKK